MRPDYFTVAGKLIADRPWGYSSTSSEDDAPEEVWPRH